MVEKQFLENLTQKLQIKADREVKESGLYEKGQKVKLVLKLPKLCPKTRPRARNTMITGEDWDKILLLPHSPTVLHGLKRLKENGNNPIDRDEFGHNGDVCLNLALNSSKLPYRLVCARLVTPNGDPGKRVMAKK